MRPNEKSDTAFRYVLDEPARILAIDDDPIQCEFAAVYLSTPTAEVETVNAARLGLARLEQQAFDIVLVDIDMPEMDGFEFLRRARADQRWRDLPIVVVTGREDVVSIDKAYECGATSFVTKPVNWRLLSYQLRFVLRSCGRPDPKADIGRAA